MSIDSFPPDVLKSQLEAEARVVSPIHEIAKNLAELVPGPVGTALSALVRRDEAEKQRIMLEVMISVLREHQDKIQSLEGRSEEGVRFFRDDWPSLVLDAIKRVRQCRSFERVRRIALILANSATEDHPPSADEVEEFMRMAVEIADQDVRVLKELVRITPLQLLAARGRLERSRAYQTWERGGWRDLGISEGDIESVFSKLESFGLVSRIAPPNNLNLLADFQNHYALLSRGMRFVRFIEDTADGDHAGSSTN